MSTDRFEREAQCPFYHRSNRNFIQCLGEYQLQHIKLYFVSVPALKEWAEDYCNDARRCRECYMYKQLEELYELKILDNK